MFYLLRPGSRHILVCLDLNIKFNIVLLLVPGVHINGRLFII